MGDFKLNKEIKVKYDKATNSYLFEPVVASKMKKLASRAFACMNGANPYESVGKTILERYKMIETEDIDEYWGIRGDIAELLVLDFMKETYKNQGIDVDLRTWNKEAVSYDNFRKNERFGGLLDIAIANPEENRAVIEVKSKSMKDFDKIRSNRGNKEEVQQGLFLTYLSNVSKCLMVYVFFTPEQEQTIKQYIVEKNDNKQHYETRDFAEMLIMKMDLTPRSVSILVFKYDIEAPNKLYAEMETAYTKLASFGLTNAIKESDFRASEITYLRDLCGIDDVGLF